PYRCRRKGHKVSLDPTAGQFDIENRENKAALPAIAEHRKILHRDTGDWRLVWTKPAPRGQETGGDRALECDELTPGENRFELAGGDQREQSRRQLLIVAILACVARLQPEPEKTVGRQGQKIEPQLDRRKVSAGGKLDRHGILEFGKFQFDRLRRPRH